MQALPFEVLDFFEPEKFNLDNCSGNSSIGYFSEVDFEYPDKLHDYRVPAEKIEVTKEMSEYQ